MMYAKRISSSPCAKLFRRSLFKEKTLCFHREVRRWEDWLMNLQIAKDNKTAVRTISASVYVYRMRSDSSSHTYVLSYNELKILCDIADDIISDFTPFPEYKKAKMENRTKLFFNELLLNGFHNEPNHPFVKDVKHCLNEAGEWRPIDRWLLSTSSSWAIKTIWNLRRVWMRLEHPSMFIRDLKRIGKLFL